MCHSTKTCTLHENKLGSIAAGRVPLCEEKTILSSQVGLPLRKVCSEDQLLGLVMSYANTVIGAIFSNCPTERVEFDTMSIGTFCMPLLLVVQCSLWLRLIVCVIGSPTYNDEDVCFAMDCCGFCLLPDTWLLTGSTFAISLVLALSRLCCLWIRSNKKTVQPPTRHYPPLAYPVTCQVPGNIYLRCTDIWQLMEFQIPIMSEYLNPMPCLLAHPAHKTYTSPPCKLKDCKASYPILLHEESSSSCVVWSHCSTTDQHTYSFSRLHKECQYQVFHRYLCTTRQLSNCLFHHYGLGLGFTGNDLFWVSLKLLTFCMFT